MRLSFWVPGEPATKGSTIPFVGGGGKMGVRPDNKRLVRWAQTVIMLTRSAMQRQGVVRKDDDAAIPSGPVRLDLTFHLPRPLSHYINGDGVRLKASAPKWHASKPDFDKLERAVGDALVKAKLVGDDGQFAAGEKEKLWADPPTGPGVSITVETIKEMR